MFQNLGIKILCLLVAMLLWVQAANTKDVEPLLRFPVNITGLPDSLTVIEDNIPESVSVRLRGSRLQLFLADVFGHDRGRVDLDLSGFRAGHHRYDVSVLDVHAPGTALEVVPPVSLDVHIERKILREVPVHLVTREQLPEGRVLVTELEVSPATVELSGPESLVKAIEQVDTGELRLGRRRESFEARLPLVSPGPEIDMRPVEVVVSAGVEAMAERVFEDLPLTVLREDERQRVEVVPSQARVVINGAASVIRALKASDISVLVTIPAGLDTLSGVAAQVVTPDGVTSARVEPATFQVVVGERR